MALNVNVVKLGDLYSGTREGAAIMQDYICRSRSPRLHESWKPLKTLDMCEIPMIYDL